MKFSFSESKLGITVLVLKGMGKVSVFLMDVSWWLSKALQFVKLQVKLPFLAN